MDNIITDDLYAVLEIAFEATEAEVKKAYRALAIKRHVRLACCVCLILTRTLNDPSLRSAARQESRRSACRREIRQALSGVRLVKG